MSNAILYTKGDLTLLAIKEGERVVEFPFISRGLALSSIYLATVSDKLPTGGYLVELGDGKAFLEKPLRRLDLGERLFVEVIMEQGYGKRAKVTDCLRFVSEGLVMSPVDKRLIVAKTIDSEDSRRLTAFSSRLENIQRYGVIFKHSAARKKEEELEEEWRQLLSSYEDIKKRAVGISKNGYVGQARSLDSRVLEELKRRKITRLITNNEEVAKAISSIEGLTAVYDERPDFTVRLGLKQAIDNSLASVVSLENNANIVINTLDTLTAVDVNISGADFGKQAQEDIVRSTNMLAVAALVREIRLRRLGGIFVVDLLKSSNKEDALQLTGRLRELLQSMNKRTRTLEINALGLLEFTVEKDEASLADIFLVKQEAEDNRAYSESYRLLQEK